MNLTVAENCGLLKFPICMISKLCCSASLYKTTAVLPKLRHTMYCFSTLLVYLVQDFSEPLTVLIFLVTLLE